jgi:hypothetical protein
MKKVYRRWWLATFGNLFICGAGMLVLGTIILISIPKQLMDIWIRL